MQKIKADNKYREKELINGLEISDGINPNKKLILGADSNHVEMDTRRTLQEELDIYRAIMGKEFVSADGSAIEVNNAIPSKVLSSEIKGNTQLFKRAKGSQDEWIVIPNDEGRDTVAFEYKLDSTQAIISNNGQSYPIYESTIQGKTRILKAPKGTQNWVEISDSEARDTVTYDYKLDSIAGDLGSVPSVSDYIDRVRKVKVVNTKEIVLNGSENWSLGNTGTSSYYYQTTLPFSTEAGGISNNYVFTSIGNSDSNQGFYITANSLLRIRYGNEKTLSDFKATLNASNLIIRSRLKTPIEIPMTDEEIAQYDAYKKVILLGSTPNKKDTLEIKDDGSAIYTQNTKDADDGSSRIDLPAPIMTHIDKSLVPTILTHNQTNILEVGGAVKPSSFKVTLPVDRIAEIEARLQALESTAVDVVLNK